jgi:hypothetical protein
MFGARLIAACVLVVACAPTTGGTTPSQSPAIGDACLVGRWVEQKESSPGNWGLPTGRIAVTGLAGLVITFAVGGTETDDYTNAQPLIGDDRGHEYKVVLRGVLTYADRADGSRILGSNPTGSVTIATYYDGSHLQTVSASFPPLPTNYKCASKTLHLESPAVAFPGYGPTVDDLTRG